MLPTQPQTNDMVGRVKGRVADLLPKDYLGFRNDLEQTRRCYATIYNGRLPRQVLNAQPPAQPRPGWYIFCRDLFLRKPAGQTGGAASCFPVLGTPGWHGVPIS